MSAKSPGDIQIKLQPLYNNISVSNVIFSVGET